MPSIDLASIKARIKKIPPIVWVVGGALIIGLWFLTRGKVAQSPVSGQGSGTGGVVGGGGGGGSSGSNTGSSTDDIQTQTLLDIFQAIRENSQADLQRQAELLALINQGSPVTSNPNTPGGTTPTTPVVPPFVSDPNDPYAGSGGNLLLQQYPSLQQFPRDITGTINFGSPSGVPGFADVSKADQAYWASKLGNNFSNVGNPDPAEFLAQYLELNRVGIQGTAFTPQDLSTGTAFAKSYADAAGVTQAQLDAATEQIRRAGGLEGTAGYNEQTALAYRRANAGLEAGLGGVIPNNAAEYIANLRQTPGVNAWTQLSNAQLADQLAINWGVSGAPVNNPTNQPLSVPVGETINPVRQDYSDEIATLNRYIGNLQGGGVTAAEQTKIDLYRARIAEYAAR